jgi:hypothetical protein
MWTIICHLPLGEMGSPSRVKETLRAGEVWDERLMQMIEEADVFQLFWSRHAMESPYVHREYEHALSLNRPNFVRPTYWEDPLPSDPARNLPPEILLRLHFQRIGPFLLSALDRPPSPWKQEKECAGSRPASVGGDVRRRSSRLAVVVLALLLALAAILTAIFFR